MPHECSRDGTPAFGYSACYTHLKARLASGEDLSDDELAFVGAYEPRRSVGGWHEPSGLSNCELDATLGTEDSRMLAALMAVGSSDQTAFLT